MKLTEDTILAKIAILYQMACASKDYNEERRKITKEIVDAASSREKQNIKKFVNQGNDMHPRIAQGANKISRLSDKLYLVT